MTEDGSRAERAGALLEASGVAAGGMAPGEAVRRADEMDTAVTPVSRTIGPTRSWTSS